MSRVLDFLLAQGFFQFADHRPELVGDLLGVAVLDLLLFLVDRLALFFGHARPAAEPLRVDDDSFDAGRHFQRVVFHVLAGPAEDRVQQLFFRRQFAPRLRRHLADQDVARHDERADPDDAVFVEIVQRLRADVRNVARELFLAELGLADFELELLDVHRGVGIVLHQPFADDDRVFEVVAVPRHERDEHVSAQGQFALVGGGPVGDHLALLDLLAHLDDRLLVLTGALVQADEFPQQVLADDLSRSSILIRSAST